MLDGGLPKGLARSQQRHKTGVREVTIGGILNSQDPVSWLSALAMQLMAVAMAKGPTRC